MMAVTLLDPPVCVGTFVVPGSLGGQLPPEGHRGFAPASAQHLTAVVFRPCNTVSQVGSLTQYYPRSACYQSAGGLVGWWAGHVGNGHRTGLASHLLLMAGTRWRSRGHNLTCTCTPRQAAGIITLSASPLTETDDRTHGERSEAD
ncbi:arginine exporter protein ArgO [Erwinia amylovora MR1]|nr:arginine exporter protein ArgO [Erwinia amylovora MR1]